MTTKTSRTDMIAADQNLIDGIQKHKSTLPSSLIVGGTPVTPDDMVVVLQGRVATGKAVVQAELAHTAAVKADRDERAKTQPQVTNFKELIVAMYKEMPDVLGDYGLAAPRPPTQTSQGNAAAAVKAAATRKLLGTKGAQQKKAAIAAAAAATAAPASPAAPAAQPGAAPAAPAAPANKGS